MTKEIAVHQDIQEEKTASLVHSVHQHGHTCILLVSTEFLGGFI